VLFGGCITRGCAPDHADIPTLHLDACGPSEGTTVERGTVDHQAEADQRALTVLTGADWFAHTGSGTPAARDAARALERVIFDRPDGIGSDRVYMAAIQETARGNAPVEVERVEAKSLGFYVDDIGVGADLQMEVSDPPGACQVASLRLRRQDLVAFFRELGTDNESATMATAAMVARGIDISRRVPLGAAPGDKPVDPDENDNVADLQHLAMVTTAAEKAWRARSNIFDIIYDDLARRARQADPNIGNDFEDAYVVALRTAKDPLDAALRNDYYRRAKRLDDDDDWGATR
jgi:hypothetical protein